ncbi:MAG: glycerol-3-phosphate 1-O-acyltransferase PlsY [Nitrospinota bacterium]|nr:glycerol-3-phosphate 1-O-acyltransferase PlsY [Nitrospinota bacterium]
MSIFFTFLACYIAGSIPTALVAGYLYGGIDIRTTGSKNAGATNLYRSFGLKLYVPVLLLDMFKGFAATLWLSALTDPEPLTALQMQIFCGIAAVFGHIFTVFARFKGGKGVATAAGMMLALIPAQVLLALAVYLVITSATHYVSLGSIGASVSLPVIFFLEYAFGGSSYEWEIYAVSAVLAALIIVTHRSNIGRLLRGEENKTYFFKRNSV